MFNTVYELIDERFGGHTEAAENPNVAQSTATDAIFLRQEPRRIAFTLCNLSVNPIFIRPNGVASAAAGILCPASSLTAIGYPDDLHMAALEWHVVSPAGASAMSVFEVRYTQEPGQLPIGAGSV